MDNLITELRNVGITLRVDGEHLVVNGPKTAMTGDLAQRIRTYKAQLIERAALNAQVEEYMAEKQKIIQALGVQEDQPGDYDHKATVAGAIPPLEEVQARQEWLSTIDWRYGLRCGLGGRQCRACGPHGTPCRNSTAWEHPGSTNRP